MHIQPTTCSYAKALRIDEPLTSRAQLRTQGINEVSTAFVANISRLKSTLLMFPLSVQAATLSEAVLMKADRDLFGTMFPLDKWIHDPVWLNRQWAERLKLRECIEADINKNPEDFERRQLARGISHVEQLFDGDHPHARSGVRAVFASVLIGTWTAFEVLVGDLWERAVNARPNPLAHLRGRPGSRITDGNIDAKRKAGWKPQQGRVQGGTPVAKGDDSKQLSLDVVVDVSECTFDLSKRMGTALKGKYDFSSFGASRRAYSHAFCHYSNKIDDILSNTTIDGLNAVRNLLVHNAGKADEMYVDVNSLGTPAPQLKLKDNLPVSGLLVESLAVPVVKLANDLIVAVDEWVQDEGDGKHVTNNADPGHS